MFWDKSIEGWDARPAVTVMVAFPSNNNAVIAKESKDDGVVVDVKHRAAEHVAIGEFGPLMALVKIVLHNPDETDLLHYLLPHHSYLLADASW